MDGLNDINANASVIYIKLQSWLNGFLALLPNLLVAAIVLGIGWLIARSAETVVRRGIGRRGHAPLVSVFGSLARWGVLVVAFFLALTVLLPSLNPGDLVAGLGISSVAVGFAFKDILQNLLSGILILVQRPFRVGDRIAAAGHEGRVEDIQTRATVVRTDDGRKVLIPNAAVYTSVVAINPPAADRLQSAQDIAIPGDADWDHARATILDAVRDVPGVMTQPGPDLALVGIDDGAQALRLNWYSRSEAAGDTQGRVLGAVRKALARADIPVLRLKPAS